MNILEEWDFIKSKKRKGQMDYILIWIGMSLSFLMGFCCRAIIGDSDDSD
jgi:hypothetical protein